MHANLSVCSFTYAAVYMCIAANFASAMQLSLTGEAKRKLKLNAINTIVFTSAQVFSHDIFMTRMMKLFASTLVYTLSLCIY